MAEFDGLTIWTDDYLADATHLTTIEHGAYFLLLVAMWRSPGMRLPNDDKMLARYVKLTAGQWARVRPILQPLFHVSSDDWTSPYLTAEANAVRRRRDRASHGGNAKSLKSNKARHQQADHKHNLSTRDKDKDKDIKKKDDRPSDGRQISRPNVTDDDLLDRPTCLANPMPTAQVPKPPDPEQSAVDAWNAMASRTGLPHVQRLTEPRKRALRARLTEAGGLDGWKTALAKVEASPFLCGRTGKREWRADFDFVLQPKSFTKLMEGAYDEHDPGPDGGTSAIDAAILRATGLAGDVAAAPADPGQPGGIRGDGGGADRCERSAVAA